MINQVQLNNTEQESSTVKLQSTFKHARRMTDQPDHRTAPGSEREEQNGIGKLGSPRDTSNAISDKAKDCRLPSVDILFRSSQIGPSV